MDRASAAGRSETFLATFLTFCNRELIETVDISFTKLSVPLEELAQGFNLSELLVEGTSDLSGGLSNTSQFQNLKVLLFWGTKVAGNTEDLARLAHLQVVSFHQVHAGVAWRGVTGFRLSHVYSEQLNTNTRNAWHGEVKTQKSTIQCHFRKNTAPSGA